MKVGIYISESSGRNICRFLLFMVFIVTFQLLMKVPFFAKFHIFSFLFPFLSFLSLLLSPFSSMFFIHVPSIFLIHVLWYTLCPLRKCLGLYPSVSYLGAFPCDIPVDEYVFWKLDFGGLSFESGDATYALCVFPLQGN